MAEHKDLGVKHVKQGLPRLRGERLVGQDPGREARLPCLRRRRPQRPRLATDRWPLRGRR